MTTQNAESQNAAQKAAQAKKPAANQFPCSNCGGPLLFTPGTTHIKCPYCGNENDIPVGEAAASGDYLKEHDFLAALERENDKKVDETATTAEVVHCAKCGADTTVSQDRTSDKCPYCGSPVAAQNHYESKLNVQAVLPFVVDSDKALGQYQDWLASRWFAPNDFKRRATREEAMNGIYMPYWTYDSATQTWYTGQRGVAYYTTETYTTQRNGKTVTETRQVRRIRWYPVSGRVAVDFDDVLVPASSSLPGGLSEKLEPWMLDKLQPFQQEFLSGFITETYKVDLRNGFEYAKGKMEPAIVQAIYRDIGGDEQRIDSKQSKYDKVTFKHILLPVWLSAYAYGGKTYRFIVNAQTGEASGERPWSFWKIAAAVVAGAAAVGALIYFMQGMQ